MVWNREEILSTKIIISEAIIIGCKMHDKEWRLDRIEMYVDHIQLRGRYWFDPPKVIREYGRIIGPGYILRALEELEREQKDDKIRILPYDKAILICGEYPL